MVFDPVLASGRGDELADEEMISAFQELLLPQTTVLTPNSLEARRLAGETDGDERERDLSLAECAQRMIKFGCGMCCSQVRTKTRRRLSTSSTTTMAWYAVTAGSDCQAAIMAPGHTLASAVAAGLAHRLSVSDAVREAQDYTWRTLTAGFRPGIEQFIPDRFFWARRTEEGGES